MKSKILKLKEEEEVQNWSEEIKRKLKRYFAIYADADELY